MRILVTGGTGTVGSQVVRELLARRADVEVLTRQPGRVPLPAGVRAVEGDLSRPETVRRVFAGVDGVFLLNPVATTEAHEGLMAVSGARRAGVRRLVYMSVHQPESASFLPHFGGKLGVEAAVRDSFAEATVLRPNNFFQNDYWFRDALLQHGVYPQPIGEAGLSRVDVRDIAEAAAIALVDGGQGGETYDLVGPEVVTGSSTARDWSAALGRPVVYGGDDMDAWERQASQMFPDWMVYDLRMMYEHFQGRGLRATEAEVARLTRLLGHPPRAFAAFATETAAAWRAAAS